MTKGIVLTFASRSAKDGNDSYFIALSQVMTRKRALSNRGGKGLATGTDGAHEIT